MQGFAVGRDGCRTEHVGGTRLVACGRASPLGGFDGHLTHGAAAGARVDMGQLDQALAVLSRPAPDPSRTGSTAARFFYAYAEVLLALGRSDEALQWFLHSAAADIEGVTDAEDRVSELA